MKPSFRVVLAVAAAALTAPLVPAMPEAQATAGRLLLRNYADAVVSIKGSITMRVLVNDRSMPFPETKINATGTVISPMGLVVSSLSMVDPHALFESMRAKMPGGGSGVVLGNTQYKDLEIVLGDGTEMDARVAWKDKDRDLVLLAPKSAPSANQSLTYVKLADAVPYATVLGDYFEIARMPAALQSAPAVRPVTVTGIIERPHRVLLTTADAVGCPVFDPKGHVLGICLRVMSDNNPIGLVVVPASAVANDVSQAAQM